MRKLVLVFSIMLALVCLALVGSIVGAGYVFDSKLGSVLSRVEQRVPGLSLAYRETDSSLTSRSGIIAWQLKLPKGNPTGLDYLSGQSRMELNFGLLKANAAFVKVPGQGNLDELLSGFGLEPIDYQAALEVKALMPKASFALKSSPFVLPLELGSCEIGENSVYFEATSLENMLTEFNGSHLKCRGSERYGGRESFLVNLENLQVKAHPSYSEGQLTVSSFDFSLQHFLADFSTLFAIGFEPDAKVKDSTLRDALEFSNIKTTLSFEEADSQGRAFLNFSGGGDFAFAFPSVSQGVPQNAYRIDKVDLKGRAGRLDIKRLFQALPKISEDNGINEIFACFSPEQELLLERFAFEHLGESMSVAGRASAAFDFAALKAQNLQADFELAGGARFVNDWAGQDYAAPLRELCSSGHVNFDGSRYQSRLTINGRDIRLNGRPLNLSAESDDLPYEEYEQE